MSTPNAACPQCGATAEYGRIFCSRCGAGIRGPLTLLPHDALDGCDAGTRVGILKRALILIIKAIGVVAALTFAFSRLSTDIGIVLFGASIVIGGFCLIALSYLDDDFLRDHMKDEGYWPSEPLGWETKTRSGKTDQNTTGGNPSDNAH